MKSPAKASLIILSAAVLAACSGTHQGGGATQAPQPEVKDPIAASAIREKAISLIQAAISDADTRVRTNAVEAAALAPERLQLVISSGLGDRNPGVRSVAAMAVGEASLTRLTGQVRPLLHDESPFVRSAALYALIRCNAPVDRTPLASMLLDDPSIRVRSQVAFILGELGDASSIPLLRQAVKGRPNGTTAEQFKLFELQVAEALIKAGEVDQRTVVRAALYPSAPEELEATALAVQIIGEVQDKEAAAQLIALSDYRAPAQQGAPGAPVKQGKPYPAEVRLAVAGALSAMGFKGGGMSVADEYARSKTPAIRAQAAFVYGQIGGPEVLPKLDAMMADPEGIVRVSAAAGVLRASKQGNPVGS